MWSIILIILGVLLNAPLIMELKRTLRRRSQRISSTINSEKLTDSTVLYPNEIQKQLTNLEIPLPLVIKEIEKWVDEGEPADQNKVTNNPGQVIRYNAGTKPPKLICFDENSYYEQRKLNLALLLEENAKTQEYIFKMMCAGLIPPVRYRDEGEGPDVW